MWYDFPEILSAAVWLYNFPDVWGSVSRMPMGYCSVSLLSSRLCTSLTLTLAPLCVQKQNIAYGPPCGLRVGWYRDGEACWLIIPITAPSVMPEEKFRIICSAERVVRECNRTCVSTMQGCGQCSTCMVHFQYRDIILVIAAQGANYSYIEDTWCNTRQLHFRIQVQVMNTHTHTQPHITYTLSHWAYNVFWSLYTVCPLWPPHTERHGQETLIHRVSVWQMRQGNNSAMNSEHIIKGLQHLWHFIPKLSTSLNNWGVIAPSVCWLMEQDLCSWCTTARL